MNQYRSLFPVTENYAYLDHAAMGPLSLPVLQFNEQLVSGLHERGYRVHSSRRDGQRSGIVVFDRPGAGMAELHQRLHDSGVICSLREGRIRVSPHFYNSGDDIERLLSALPGTY